jgi:hypothetical protein
VTLIVGIKCSNGIVLGADGAATLSVLGQNTATAKQPVKKLSILKTGAVLGVSGSVGMSQRIGGVISTIRAGTDLASTVKMIRESLWNQLFKFEFEVAQITKNTVPALAQQCLSFGLIALPIGSALELLQFDPSGAVECATKHLPFVSIGSGQATADPFLAFIRRIFWKSEPTTAEGIFAAWWTLHHSITISPGGIAEPKQIAVLEVQNNKFLPARELTTVELHETEVAVEEAEQHLKKFDRSKNIGPPPASQSIPEPPSGAPVAQKT